ncbi:hypothetical protein ACIBG8_19455 [Nonomuraea sp. NPDC050556]|uniref:hypothetical protein n=1 Tax=Nonomuraea sp. NPDC050556 TaxID=3364369 RepID=UPI00379A20B0
MTWDAPQPFEIQGWIVIDGAGGGFIALRLVAQADKVNVVCGKEAPDVRKRIAQADGVTPIEQATRQRRNRRPGATTRRAG